MQTAQQAMYDARYKVEFMKECYNTYLLLDDEETKEWYYYAIRALEYASPMSLGMTMQEYMGITEVVDNGINLNNVAALCNNLESRNPYELNLSQDKYMNVIRMNINIANYWKKTTQPIHELVKRRIVLMNNSGGKVAKLQ